MNKDDRGWSTLGQLDDWLRTPMLLPSLLWLVIVVLELTQGKMARRERFERPTLRFVV